MQFEDYDPHLDSPNNYVQYRIQKFLRQNLGGNCFFFRIDAEQCYVAT